eukprot:scaffold203062_cov70-Attheya_sp.AAC.5
MGIPMSSLPHAEETDIPMVHFFCLVVEIEVHPKDTSSGLVGSARYLRGPLEGHLVTPQHLGQ